MAGTVDEVTVRARVRDEMSKPLRSVRGEVEHLGKAADQAGRAARQGAAGINRFEAAARGAVPDINRLHRATMGLSRDITGGLVTGLRHGAVAFGVAAAAATAFGLQSASSFQQTRIALDGFLGSAEAGRAIFDYLQQMNLKTPFELGDLAGGARQLLGFGFAAEETKRLLESSVNVAAGLGVGDEGLNRILLNLGQVRAAGVITGRELRDFATMGVPGYELVANIIGKSAEEIRAMGDDAQVSADQFIGAFTRMQGPLARFGGMAEAQMKSLSGQWSNFKDVLTVGMADAAKPLVDDLTRMMPGISDSVGGFVGTVGPEFFGLVGDVVEVAVKALPVIQPVVLGLVEGMGTFVRGIGPALPRVIPVAERLGVAFGDLASGLGPVMPDVVDAMVALAGVAPSFVGLLGDLVPIIGPIARVATDFLEFAPVNAVMAPLLTTLLGYRALTGVGGILLGVASGLRAVASAGGVGGSGGRGRGAGRAGRAASAGAMGIMGGPIGVAGSLAIAGALEVGTEVAHLGAGESWRRTRSIVTDPLSLFRGPDDDERRRRAGTGDAVLNLSRTVGMHSAIDGLSPGSRRITSGIRFAGTRPGSGHRDGTVIDVAGSNLASYASNVRRAGGAVALHDAGNGYHAHTGFGDTPLAMPGGRSGGGGGSATVILNVYGASGADLTERIRTGALEAVRLAERDDRERHLLPLGARRR